MNKRTLQNEIDTLQRIRMNTVKPCKLRKEVMKNWLRTFMLLGKMGE